jgi:ankyrin repeat protein
MKSSPGLKKESSFHIAARNGDIEAVRIFLSNLLLDPNIINANGATALHLASQNGYIDIVIILLADQRVNPNALAGNGVSPLHLASQNGHTGIVRILLSDLRVNPNTVNINGVTPLYSASQSGQIGTVKMLLSDLRIDPLVLAAGGSSVLHIAARGRHIEVVIALLEDLRINPSIQTIDGATPLHFASQEGYLDIVRILLADFRINTNLLAVNGFTALHLACQNGHVDVVRALLANLDTNPEIPAANGITPIQLAMNNGYIRIVNILSLHISVQNGDIENIERLFDYDSDIDTLLNLALRSENIEIIELMLRKNIKPSIFELTPFDIAIMNENVDLIRILLSISYGQNLLKEDELSRITSPKYFNLKISYYKHTFLYALLKCINLLSSEPLYSSALTKYFLKLVEVGEGINLPNSESIDVTNMLNVRLKSGISTSTIKFRLEMAKYFFEKIVTEEIESNSSAVFFKLHNFVNATQSQSIIKPKSITNEIKSLSYFHKLNLDIITLIMEFIGSGDSWQEFTIPRAISSLTSSGYEIENVAGDGNCLFHAVARQLGDLTYQELRALAVNYILEHLEEFHGFMAEDISVYIETMSKEGTWADNLIIQALANALGININIFRADDGTINRITPTNAESLNDPILLLFTGNHYLAVLRPTQTQNEIEPVQNLEEVVYQIDENITVKNEQTEVVFDIFEDNTENTLILGLLGILETLGSYCIIS